VVNYNPKVKNNSRIQNSFQLPFR